MAYPETPRTDAGNATYLTNGPDFENLSMEKSFLPPSKGTDGLLSQLRNSRGHNLKTPRTRAPLRDQRNLPAAKGQSEFTPLLKSVGKKNLLRGGQANGVPQTPTFLKPGYNGNADSTALPGAESSMVYEDDTGSSVWAPEDATPVFQVASSSAQSTPLAVLPRRDAGGVLADQGNMMTLREQENIINKVEKENFGLKLKIHFLEDSLRKAGPGFHEAALKENTELKVDKVTMQKELMRIRKTLSQAERDLEAYRLHLQEVQEKVKQKHVDEATREELGDLREAVQHKEVEIAQLRRKLDLAEVRKGELESLRTDVDDQEAELREKNRAIEQKDEEIGKLQEEARTAIDDRDKIRRLEENVGDLEEEIREKKRAIEQKDEEIGRLQEEARTAIDDRDEIRRLEEDVGDLEEEIREKNRAIEQNDEEIGKLQEEARTAIDDQDEIRRLKDDVGDLEEEILEKNRIVEAKQEAMKRLEEEAREAREDLDELRLEMANKSFNTKGLSRQLEEKANRLNDDLSVLRKKHADLETRFLNKEQQAIQLQKGQDEGKMREEKLRTDNERLREEKLRTDNERLRDEKLRTDNERLREEKLRTDNERLRNQQNDIIKERDSLILRLQQAVQDLQSRTEERDRLQSQCDGLEDEVEVLQNNIEDDRTIAEERKDLHEMLRAAKVELEERKDLHEMLKDAKVKLEELVSDRDARIAALATELENLQRSTAEERLRGQLKRVRDDRTHETKKNNALVIELADLQHRYEGAVDNLARQQQEWEEERKAIVSRVRFPNMSVSSIHAGPREPTELKQLELEIQGKERRHQSEVRLLSKQVQWISAKCTREEGFRSGLAYEKKFLLLQIEMFKACNAVDLRILEEIGVAPGPKERGKKPSLKVAGCMVLAVVRMRKMQTAWAGQKKLHASLARKFRQSGFTMRGHSSQRKDNCLKDSLY